MREGGTRTWGKAGITSAPWAGNGCMKKEIIILRLVLHPDMSINFFKAYFLPEQSHHSPVCAPSCGWHHALVVGTAWARGRRWTGSAVPAAEPGQRREGGKGTGTPCQGCCWHSITWRRDSGDWCRGGPGLGGWWGSAGVEGRAGGVWSPSVCGWEPGQPRGSSLAFGQRHLTAGAAAGRTPARGGQGLCDGGHGPVASAAVSKEGKHTRSVTGSASCCWLHSPIRGFWCKEESDVNRSSLRETSS